MQVDCQYCGTIPGKYQGNNQKNGLVFAIKQKSDLTELVKRKLISQANHDLVETKINLKDRNIILIYNVLPGMGVDFYIKTINVSPLEISVNIISMSCPFKGGLADMSAKYHVLGAPKQYDKENFRVSFNELDIYSEPEFADFKGLCPIDEELERTYFTLDPKVQAFAKSYYYQETSGKKLKKESWFATLTNDQKETVQYYIKALFSRDEKIKALDKEKLKEHESDQIRRYSKLRQRLEKPVIS